MKNRAVKWDAYTRTAASAVAFSIFSCDLKLNKDPPPLFWL